jgi:uncharacterized phage protein (TIGR01671 family)
MSREIKFRVWSKETKSFLHADDIAICNNGNVLIYDWHHDYGKSWGPSFDNHAIQQYTGLKDRNGVEIYEGDVIESFYSGKYPEPIEVHVVKAETRCGGFSPFVDKYDTEWYAGEFEQPNIEVIGNLYENPELLNDEN